MLPWTRPRDRVPTRVGTPTPKAVEKPRESGCNWERAALEEHRESAMAGRENVMQVLCTGLQEQVAGSAYSE
ncbi:hypothetical protein NDU88_003258 [Pleurodeles waltl]|uniref:Uncharacterized protein n=1 Tax=Pleurodeles waltl TaxID=8319 RepID=A0AAV7L3G4_PLEWA|nr:hypothetical protein NDU88_003258 [Pleurodeles waltl]